MSALGASPWGDLGSIAPKVPCPVVPRSYPWWGGVRSRLAGLGGHLSAVVRAGAGTSGSGQGSTVAQGWSLFGRVPLAVGTHAGGGSLAFGSPPW